MKVFNHKGMGVHNSHHLVFIGDAVLKSYDMARMLNPMTASRKRPNEPVPHFISFAKY